MIRRTLHSGAIGALALFLVFTPARPQAQGQQNGLQALAGRVAVLEGMLADLRADLGGTSEELGARLNALEGLVAAINLDLATVQGGIGSLRNRVDALENALSMLGGGLTAYDQLNSLPCTTALNAPGTVHIVGLLRSPICAVAVSASGRFIRLGPVVLDTQTNLVWEIKDQTGGLHDVGNGYSWCAATGNNSGICAENETSWISQVNAELFAGFSNWRVPTQEELLSIVDFNAGPPLIDPIFGPTTPDYYYWTTREFQDVYAFGVWFGDGLPSAPFKLNPLPVRAVRTGP